MKQIWESTNTYSSVKQIWESTNTYIYDQLIFDEAVKKYNKERLFFQQMMLKHLKMQMQRNKVAPNTKINSKWIKNLNLRGKNIIYFCTKT